MRKYKRKAADFKVPKAEVISRVGPDAHNGDLPIEDVYRVTRTALWKLRRENQLLNQTGPAHGTIYNRYPSESRSLFKKGFDLEPGKHRLALPKGSNPEFWIISGTPSYIGMLPRDRKTQLCTVSCTGSLRGFFTTTVREEV